MGFRNLIAGLAIAAVSAITANAATVSVISGGSDSATFTASDTVVGTGPTAFSGSASVFLQAVDQDDNGLTATLQLTNSSADAVDLVATVNRLSAAGSPGFVDPEVRVTSADGTTTFFTSDAPVGPSPSQFTIGAFQDFNIVLTYTGLNELITTGGGKAVQAFNVTVNSIPLPAGLALLLTALGGLALIGRRRGTAAAAA